jgi:hypothetical protein
MTPFIFSVCILLFFYVYGTTDHTNPDTLIGKDLGYIYEKGYKRHSRHFIIPNKDEGNYRQVVGIMYKDKMAVYEKITKEDFPLAADKNADMSAESYFLSPFAPYVPDLAIGTAYDDVVEKLGGPPAMKWRPDSRGHDPYGDDYSFLIEYFQRGFEYNIFTDGCFGYKISNYILQLVFDENGCLIKIGERHSGLP